jgi:hypothetical protein
MDEEIWKGLPCRRCPSCLLSNPAGCAECLTCGVAYGAKIKQDVIQESLPKKAPRKNSVSADEDDDDKVITWEEEHRLPVIVPVRDEDEYGLPVFDIGKMIGRRSRVCFG